MDKNSKLRQCHLCNEYCPQAEMAKDIASGRMYATKELIECQKELEAYRAIGTVEDLETMKENGAFSGLELAQICAMQMKLKEYQEAEHQGQLRAVPLKIGDEAWAIRNYNGVKHAQKGTVREMFYTQDMRLCIAVDRVARGEFGKKVFRTKEEAEAAIGRGM